jgi:hypothetical protein
MLWRNFDGIVMEFFSVMLLTALRMFDDSEYATMGAYGNALEANDVAYADDLIVARATLKGMQNAADIISGFTILTGLSFSVGKFRAFAINWGMRKSQCIRSNGLKRQLTCHRMV